MNHTLTPHLAYTRPNARGVAAATLWTILSRVAHSIAIAIPSRALRRLIALLLKALHLGGPVPSTILPGSPALKRIYNLMRILLGSTVVSMGLWRITILPRILATFKARTELVEVQRARWVSIRQGIKEIIRSGGLYNDELTGDDSGRHSTPNTGGDQTAGQPIKTTPSTTALSSALLYSLLDLRLSLDSSASGRRKLIGSIKRTNSTLRLEMATKIASYRLARGAGLLPVSSQNSRRLFTDSFYSAMSRTTSRLPSDGIPPSTMVEMMPATVRIAQVLANSRDMIARVTGTSSSPHRPQGMETHERKSLGRLSLAPGRHLLDENRAREQVRELRTGWDPRAVIPAQGRFRRVLRLVKAQGLNSSSTGATQVRVEAQESVPGWVLASFQHQGGASSDVPTRGPMGPASHCQGPIYSDPTSGLTSPTAASSSLPPPTQVRFVHQAQMADTSHNQSSNV